MRGIVFTLYVYYNGNLVRASSVAVLLVSWRLCAWTRATLDSASEELLHHAFGCS